MSVVMELMGVNTIFPSMSHTLTDFHKNSGFRHRRSQGEAKEPQPLPNL